MTSSWTLRSSVVRRIDESDAQLVLGIEQHPIWQAKTKSDLAVVLAHFNPCGYRRPVANLLLTLDHLFSLNASAYLSYLTFPSRPHPLTLFTSISFAERVRSLESSTVWFHKEALWNQAVTNLVPPGVEKILLLDADVLFVGQAPLTRISDRLDKHRAVHPFAFVNYLDPDGRVMLRRASVGHAVSSGWPGASDPRRYHAGSSMALRRSFWEETEGLYLAPVGGGDTLLCAALTGRWRDLEQEMVAQSPSNWEGYRAWARRVESWSSGKLVDVRNDLVHLYHGASENRRYDERRNYIAGFNPQTHVLRSPDGLPEWSELARSTVPQMVAEVEYHFTKRREDE